MRRAGAGTGYALTPRMLVFAIGSLLLIQGASTADQDNGEAQSLGEQIDGLLAEEKRAISLGHQFVGLGKKSVAAGMRFAGLGKRADENMDHFRDENAVDEHNLEELLGGEVDKKAVAAGMRFAGLGKKSIDSGMRFAGLGKKAVSSGMRFAGLGKKSISSGMRFAGLGKKSIDYGMRFAGLGKRGGIDSGMRFAGLGKRNQIDVSMRYAGLGKRLDEAMQSAGLDKKSVAAGMRFAGLGKRSDGSEFTDDEMLTDFLNKEEKDSNLAELAGSGWEDAFLEEAAAAELEAEKEALEEKLQNRVHDRSKRNTEYTGISRRMVLDPRLRWMGIGKK